MWSVIPVILLYGLCCPCWWPPEDTLLFNMKHGRKEHGEPCLEPRATWLPVALRDIWWTWFYNGGKFCSWWCQWPADRAAAFAPLVSRMFEPPCREFRLLPFFLPWLQMLPHNPRAKNKQTKNPRNAKALVEFY